MTHKMDYTPEAYVTEGQSARFFRTVRELAHQADAAQRQVH